ncbi:hypothetical protein RMSM_02585 [Rhodopirellula maiorica SM1]|uniref:Uncharacterized protein n=2 Tax=Novipirellula TaxID=2795426 RepID=M5RMG2_9BACT|nr:hypothetical protein RMSM_02585 [Rhodopirellula maiorica SM1]
MSILYAGAPHGISRSLDAINVIDPAQKPVQVAAANRTAIPSTVSAESLASSTVLDLGSQSVGTTVQSNLSMPDTQGRDTQGTEAGKQDEAIHRDEFGTTKLASTQTGSNSRQDAGSSHQSALDPESVDALLTTLSNPDGESSTIEAFSDLLQ